MATGKSTIGDLIEKLEALLGRSGGRTPPVSGLSGGIAGALGPTLTGGDGKDAVSSLAEGLLGGGAGLVAGWLRSLFGGESERDPALPFYNKPGAMFLEYDVNASARPGRNAEPEVNLERRVELETGGRGETKTPSPTVVVQVNALDAQSFSARSDDIASAVREALARNHALRDEIWED